jgi:hypothetical protein
MEVARLFSYGQRMFFGCMVHQILYCPPFLSIRVSLRYIYQSKRNYVSSRPHIMCFFLWSIVFVYDGSLVRKLEAYRAGGCTKF